VLSLFKPQYESPPDLVHRGRIKDGAFEDVLSATLAALEQMGIPVWDVVRLPQERKRKNPEAILHIRREGS